MRNTRTRQNSVCCVGSVAEGVWRGQWKSLVSRGVYACVKECVRQCQLMFLVEWRDDKQQYGFDFAVRSFGGMCCSGLKHTQMEIKTCK